MNIESDNPYSVLTDYELRYSIEHLINAGRPEDFEELEQFLIDLQFIEAKCIAGMTYDLVKDYDAAVTSLTEAQEEKKKEHERDKKIAQYEEELVAYARAQNQVRQTYREDAKKCFLRQPEEIRFPNPPDTETALAQMCQMEAIREETNLSTMTTRIDRIRAFGTFVSTCSHLLSAIAKETISIARNHAETGIVVEDAERLISLTKRPWVGRDPRPTQIGCQPAHIRTLEGHSDVALTIALKPDGKIAISGGQDKDLRVWDLQTGLCVQVLEGHSDKIRSVVMTPDGKTCLSAGADHELRLWDLSTYKCIYVFDRHRHEVVSVAITPDGKTAF